MKKRVVQVSFDIVIPAEYDGCHVAEIIARDLEKANYDVLGHAFVDDMTRYYKEVK